MASSTDPAPVLKAHLPEGVRLRALETHVDHRGDLTELFRSEWETGITPVQWNITRSQQDTLRGVHVHIRHVDYIVLLTGRASIGLRDLRVGSPTVGHATVVELAGSELRTLTIPPGVAHGFYFREPSLMLYSVSHYWAVDDEFACRWDDPALEIPWRAGDVRLSERDASAQPLSGLLSELEPWQPIGAPPLA